MKTSLIEFSPIEFVTWKENRLKFLRSNVSCAINLATLTSGFCGFTELIDEGILYHIVGEEKFEKSWEIS